jgi:hypothetical protein
MYLEAVHLETGKPKIEWSAKMPVPIIQATISKNCIVVLGVVW